MAVPLPQGWHTAIELKLNLLLLRDRYRRDPLLEGRVGRIGDPALDCSVEAAKAALCAQTMFISVYFSLSL